MFRDSDPSHAEQLTFLGAKLIGTTEAGEIYRKKLARPHFHLSHPVVPKAMLDYIGPHAEDGDRYRRGLYRKLIENSPNPMPMVGKPSSVFVFIDSKKTVYLDYLVESPTFVRGRVVHHTYMRNFDAESGNQNYSPENLLTRDSMWSGHAAGLTSEYKSLDYGHVILLDKFSSPSEAAQYESLIRIFHENHMVPLTARGYILPR